MKQIINKRGDSSIRYKYYENDRGQKHGLFIGYLSTSELNWKRNFVSGKQYGIDYSFNSFKKITSVRYYL